MWYDFHSAAMYIARIPYGRNSNRDNYELVLTERVGTSSTKHALLRQLCKEQGVYGIHLVAGIYEMNEKNTPVVGEILSKYSLDSLLGAHCYLTFENKRFDFTRIDSISEEPIHTFLIEIKIEPHQIRKYIQMPGN